LKLTRFIAETFTGARIERTETSDFNTDLFETQVGDFWANLAMTMGASNPTLLERVWVANRCQHLNSNAISTMPLRHFGGREPAWVANPDPAWYPNGIADAMYAIVWSMYGWGDAFLYVTDRYADGYPSAWTVLNPEPMDVTVVNGQRRYRSGQTNLNENNVVQISRNPTGGVRGTSAIKSAAAYTNGLLAAASLSRVMMASGGTPNTVLKSKKKIDADQALAIQTAWMSRSANRGGAPAVLGPDLEFEQNSFSPADLMLLDVQAYNAQVIAAMYGVPAQMVNLPLEGGLNYQTPVLMLEQWWRTELRTTADRIGKAISANMLPAGQYVESDAREFLAPAHKDLVDAWNVLVTMGAATAEEARVAILKLPPSATLEDLGSPPSAGASPAQQSPSVVELRPTAASSSY
jgi:HK97 family phage portal protein